MSQNDDPFAAFGNDRTVIKPSAGRPQGQPGQPGMQSPAGMPSPMAAPPSREAPLAMDALTASASLNPLVSVAMPLLSAAPRIRHSAQHPNPAGLKQALAEGLQAFEAQARQQGLPNEQIIAARYILCTLLDESASSTPWGGGGAWGAHSLLVQFHNESWGGEKIFQLLGKLAENVPGNRNLLELLYVVLAFGFEGRYRVIDNGRAQLDGVRQRLAQMLRGDAAPDPALSPRWQGVQVTGKLRSGWPLWVIASALGLGLLLIYLAFRFAINSASDQAFTALRSFDVKTAALPPPPAAAPRLSTSLAAEIRDGLLQVRDLADRSVVIIRGDGLFDPGSADLKRGLEPLVKRIGEALNQHPGQVLVNGFTDSQPIRSVRFESNWHLSQARAESFRRALLDYVPGTRIRAEGRADADPVAPNTTPEGRAQNRRVELTLFVSAGQQ
jgi:type VI secretion system protein ImpK